jgi:cephalosporin hydroxylase
MDQRFLALTRGAYQSREELAWLWRELLLPLRPRRIIEIGVAAGGTTRLFLDVAGGVAGNEGLVLGIDVDDRQLAADVRTHPRFRLLLGPSANANVVAQAKAIIEDCDLLLIDGDHSEAGVLADTVAYLPLVRPGGLVLWHDVQLESPSGIKRVWYRVLKPQLPAASEHFVDPFNTGFGIWRKTDDVTINRFDAAAIETSTLPRAADPIAEAMRVANDVSAMRSAVSAAILRGLDAPGEAAGKMSKPTSSAARNLLVDDVAPRVAASFVRLQKWEDGIEFVEAVLARAPAFAPHGLVALTAGLRRANQLGAARAELVERSTASFLDCLERAPGDEGDACARFARGLRECRRAELAIAVCRAGLTRTAQHRNLRYTLVAALLELRTGVANDAGLIAEARGLLRSLHHEAPRDWETTHLFVGTEAGDADEMAAARTSLIEHTQQGRIALDVGEESSDQKLDERLRQQLERFGFAVVKRALLPSLVAALREAACAPVETGRLETTTEQMIGQNAALASAIRAHLGGWFIESGSRTSAETQTARRRVLVQDAWIRPAGRRALGGFVCVRVRSAEAIEATMLAHRLTSLFPIETRGHAQAHPPSLAEDLIVKETWFHPQLAPGDLILWTNTTAHAHPAGALTTPNGGIGFRLVSRDHDD